MPMRTLLALIVSSSLLLLVAAAGAKTVTVTITKNGYVPNSLTIAQGDTVQFTNGDTSAHQVEFKTTTGVTCSANPLVVQPGASATCTFANAGNYNYSDPNVKGNTYRGSITVTAPPTTITLAAKPVLLIYGGRTALTGTITNLPAGQSVDVYAQACGSSAQTKLATFPGTFTYTTPPSRNTVYTAKGRTVTSNAVTVQVRPLLQLRKVAAHKFSLTATATESFAGKYASFQRYNGTLKKWVAVKTIALKAGPAATAPTVLSTSAFRSTIKAKLRVRVTMPQAQVGSCYAPGLSNTIYS
jgi:plastocyanin